MKSIRKLQEGKLLIHPHDHKGVKDWEKIFDFLERNLDFDGLESFLDLGAGMGNLSYFFLKKNPSCHTVCVDVNQDYLDIIAKRNHSIKTISYDINKRLPFGDNSFDIVSCMGTLQYSYIKQPEIVLGEMVRVSRKYIFIDCFSKYSPWVLFERIFYPKFNPRRRSFSEMEEVFKKYSLNIVDIIGSRTLFSRIFPFSGKTVFFLLKK